MERPPALYPSLSNFTIKVRSILIASNRSSTMVSSTRPPPPPYTPAPTSDNAANPTNDEAFFRALLTEVQQEQWNIVSPLSHLSH